MEAMRVSLKEWKQLTDEEQRARIRESYTPVEDLPDDMRAQVEEMLANAHRFTD
jgi:predicted nucleotide-binding protein (sugar kinase/HSP70/actin superfamily)